SPRALGAGRFTWMGRLVGRRRACQEQEGNTEADGTHRVCPIRIAKRASRSLSFGAIRAAPSCLRVVVAPTSRACGATAHAVADGSRSHRSFERTIEIAPRPKSGELPNAFDAQARSEKHVLRALDTEPLQIVL